MRPDNLNLAPHERWWQPCVAIVDAAARTAAER